MKIVINTDWGGFSLSKEGEDLYRESTGQSYFDACDALNWSWEMRADRTLVDIIELDAERYGGDRASLKVVEIPDDVEWYIHDYDGMEHIAEKHRTWS